ncbi:MAG: S8 family serine peptidase [Proteobacteria bacterium]|nr:S8 family serine peptidase [Pseudomonadota bacterium]
MMKRSQILFIGLVCIQWAVSSSQAGSIHPDLLLTLKDMSPEEEISVIVTLSDQENLSQFTDKDKKVRRSKINRALRDKAGKTQKSLREFLRKNKVAKVTPLWIVNGMAVTLRADQVAELARRTDVQSLSLDAILSLPLPSPALSGVPEWNLEAINAPALWALGYTGTGVVVASMDTGVDAAHPDLAPRWRGGSNSWFDPNGEYSTPYDTSGHGTQTMGVMVGGDAGGSAIGVAPDARWIAVKLFNNDGFTSYSAIHQGFQWLLDPDGDPDTDDLPDVVNNSWGFDGAVDQCFEELEFRPDIQALKSAGVAVVFSAGNAGPNPSTSVSLANYPESFAVGSVDELLQVTSTSSRGPSACDGTIFPELVSPGVTIRTADLTSAGTYLDSYAFVSGTSIAGPHIAGAMALLISVNPELTVAELETVLMQSATDLGDFGADNVYGYGLLNLAASYDLFTTYSLNVNVSGGGDSSVVSDPHGISCPVDCQGEYVEGRLVTLTAVPASNSRFAGWSGDCTGMELLCQVTMNQVKNVSASFYSFPWSLFVPIKSKQP